MNEVQNLLIRKTYFLTFFYQLCTLFQSMKVELVGASATMNTFTISVQILLLFFPFLIEGQSYRTKDVDALCVTVNCGLQSTACFLDGECAKVFTVKMI